MSSITDRIKETYSGQKRLLLTAGVISFATFGYQAFPGTIISMFFTDIVSLPPLLASAVEIFRNVIISFAAPFMGLLLDRVSIRGRHYSAWYQLGAIITVVTGLVVFAIPAFVDSSSVVVGTLIVLVFIVSEVARNIVSINSRAIMKDLSKDPKERAVYSKNSNIFKEIGRLLISLAYPVLIVEVTERTNEKFAYFVTYVLVAVIYVLVIFWLAHEIKKYLKSDKSEERQTKAKSAQRKGQTNAVLKTVFANKALLITFVATIFVLGRTMLSGPMNNYYFKYVAEDFSKLTVYSGLVTPVTVGGLLISPLWIKMCGDTKRSMTFAAFISGITMVGLKFVGSNWLAYVIIQVIGMGFISIFNASVVVMFMNAADYGEWKYGVASHAVIAGVFTVATKIASAICSAYRGASLQAIGFVGGMDPTPELAAGITNIIGIYGIVICAASLLYLLVPLSDKKMQEIKVELELRKQEKTAKTVSTPE